MQGGNEITGLNVNKGSIDKNRLEDFFEQIVKGAGNEKSIPCISVTLQKLLAINAESELSAQELAEIILDDYGLISKVLQTVNTFYYNRLGHKITTVTQAVILLGFNAVRQIAVSLSIIDILPGSGNKIAARLMATAFVASHLSASFEDNSSGNPEEVFLAALFKPLARLFAAITDPDFYQYVEDLEGEYWNNPEQEIFSSFWKKLGKFISEEWHIPDTLAKHLEGLDVRDEEEKADMAYIISLCSELARGFVNHRSFEQLAPLIDSVERKTGITSVVLADRLEKSLSRTMRNAAAFSIILRDVKPKEVMSPLLDGALIDIDETSFTTQSVSEDESRYGVCLDLTSQMLEVITSGQLSLNQVFMLAVEVMKRGIGLDNILLCLFTLDRKELSGRFGLGSQLNLIKKKILISDPMKVSLINKAFIKDVETKGQWEELIGPNSDQEFRKNEICISPLSLKGKNIGCFIMDKGGDVFTNNDIKQVRIFRELVILASMQKAIL